MEAATILHPTAAERAIGTLITDRGTAEAFLSRMVTPLERAEFQVRMAGRRISDLINQFTGGDIAAALDFLLEEHLPDTAPAWAHERLATLKVAQTAAQGVMMAELAELAARREAQAASAAQPARAA